MQQRKFCSSPINIFRRVASHNENARDVFRSGNSFARAIECRPGSIWIRAPKRQAPQKVSNLTFGRAKLSARRFASWPGAACSVSPLRPSFVENPRTADSPSVTGTQLSGARCSESFRRATRGTKTLSEGFLPCGTGRSSGQLRPSRPNSIQGTSEARLRSRVPPLARTHLQRPFETLRTHCHPPSFSGGSCIPHRRSEMTH